MEEILHFIDILLLTRSSRFHRVSPLVLVNLIVVPPLVCLVPEEVDLIEVPLREVP